MKKTTMMRFKLFVSSCFWTMFLFCALSEGAVAQCQLVPIALPQRVQQSSLIVEGAIQSKRCVWDDLHHNIYTIYSVEVSSIFKGQLTDATIDFVEKGGQVGDDLHVVTNAFFGNVGQTGVFMLMPTNDPITTARPLYECYSGVQGVIHYEAATQTAHGVFDAF
jgi:hypothetical protein